MPQHNYLCEFSHPTTWKDVFDTIIEKLGPEFSKWNKGLGFENDETVLVIHHQDGSTVRVLLHNIYVFQPRVAGSWFTALSNAIEKKSEQPAE